MSSRDGFARADVDTNLLHDRKVLALARRLHDPVRTACALMLWEAALLASWNEGARVPLADAAPAWWTDDTDEYGTDLHAVGLLDADGRIPGHAFGAWIGAALGRRVTAERAGAIGGLMSRHGMTYTEAIGELDRRDSQGTLKAPSTDPEPSQPASQPATQPAGLAGNGEFLKNEEDDVSWEEQRGVPKGTVSDDPDWQVAFRRGDFKTAAAIETRLIAEYRERTAP